MGRRNNRRRPTRRQKMEANGGMITVETRRAVNPQEKTRLVACGVIRKGVSSVTRVDFGHFRKPVHDGPLPALDAMSDMGRKVVISIATKMRLTPQEIIERVSG